MNARPLSGLLALVTGAGRGIGAATARALAASGANLVLTSRTEAELESVAADARREGVTVRTIAGDITDDAFVARLFADLGPQLDILVNNAGMAAFAPIAEVPANALRTMLEVNTVAPYACMREAIAHMTAAHRDGIIVNVGSVEAHWASQGESGAYPASKFALRALTLAVSKQLKRAGSGIRVSQVDPGGVDTTLQDLPAEAAPLLLDPDDVARTILHVVTAPSDVHIADVIVVAQPFATW